MKQKVQIALCFIFVNFSSRNFGKTLPQLCSSRHQSTQIFERLLFILYYWRLSQIVHQTASHWSRILYKHAFAHRTICFLQLVLKRIKQQAIKSLCKNINHSMWSGPRFTVANSGPKHQPFVDLRLLGNVWVQSLIKGSRCSLTKM